MTIDFVDFPSISYLLAHNNKFRKINVSFPMYMSSLATLSAPLILVGKSTHGEELGDKTQQVGQMRVFGVKGHSSAVQ